MTIRFDISLINKFQTKQLNEFLKDKISDYNKKLFEEIPNFMHGRERINKVLSDHINELESSEEEEDADKLQLIEDSFFNFLFYQDQDTYYNKRISKNTGTIVQILKKISDDENFSEFLNKKLYNVDNNIGLVTIRQEKKDLLLLFNYGTQITRKKKEEKQFLVSCRINFEHKILSIGLKDSMISQINENDKANFENKRTVLIKKIIRQIKMMGVEVENFSSEKIESALYKMFVVESNKALEVIKTKLTTNDPDSKTIKEFQDITEKFLVEQLKLINPKGFIDKAMSLKYQDQAMEMDSGEYISHGGYIFGFSFVEKDITRSENKNDKRQPIYKSELYWSIKDIIDKYPRLSNLSMFWRFNKFDFDILVYKSDSNDLASAEVEYRSLNNELIIYYFVKSSNNRIDNEASLNRKRREDFAIQKINGYL